MKFGSNYCWLKPSQNTSKQSELSNNSQSIQDTINENTYYGLMKKQHENEQNLDANVVTITFDKLKEAEAHIQMGDPIFCKGCKAVLSKISKLQKSKKQKGIHQKENKNEVLQQRQVAFVEVEEQEEEEVKENKNSKMKKDVQKRDGEDEEEEEEEEQGKMIWNCEFCSRKNILRIEGEEIPQSNEVVYMFESVNVWKNKKQKEEQEEEEEEQVIIFVIDVSGSMSVTTPIQNKEINKFKHSSMVSQEEFEMLKQFMDEQDILQYTQMQQSQNFISRKQCVLAAIQQQMDDLLDKNPNKKVGLIVFNNEVTIYGSGSVQPIVITGEKLYRVEEIYQLALNCSKELFNLPVKESKDLLLKIFDSIKEKDQTALGPAIVAALGVVSQQKKGSQIIVCTDGLTNVGVGSFEDQDSNNYIQFYEDVKARAIENDAVFNIISIKGQGCKLDILGSIADKTGGNVIRVDPDSLHKNFANIIQDEVVALKAEMTIYLKNTMKFRNVDKEVDKISENGSKCVKYIGNATHKTIATFEYTNKTEEEIIEQNLEEIDMRTIDLPFQSQISYYNLQGHKMIHVFTRNQETTFDKRVAEKSLDYQVISQRIATHTAQLIQNNNFSQAKTFNKGWEKYVETNEELNEESRDQFRISNQILKNNAYKKQTIATDSRSKQTLSSNECSFPSIKKRVVKSEQLNIKKDAFNSIPKNLILQPQDNPRQQHKISQSPQLIEENLFKKTAYFKNNSGGGIINENVQKKITQSKNNGEEEGIINQSAFKKTAYFKNNEKDGISNENVQEIGLFSKQNNVNENVQEIEELSPQQNGYQIIKDSDDDENNDAFSDDGNCNEKIEQDEIETFLYQNKNNKL